MQGLLYSSEATVPLLATSPDSLRTSWSTTHFSWDLTWTGCSDSTNLRAMQNEQRAHLRCRSKVLQAETYVNQWLEKIKGLDFLKPKKLHKSRRFRCPREPWARLGWQGALASCLLHPSRNAKRGSGSSLAMDIPLSEAQALTSTADSTRLEVLEPPSKIRQGHKFHAP